MNLHKLTDIRIALPSLHPGFCELLNPPLGLLTYLTHISLKAIPTEDNGGNHTPAFTRVARTLEAHKACLNVSKALAGLGVKVLMDSEFVQKVRVCGHFRTGDG